MVGPYLFVLGMGVTIAAIGWPIRVWQARRSEEHRIRGWYVYGFCVVGYFVGAGFGAILGNGFTSYLLGMTALMTGPIFGNVVGWVAARYFVNEAEEGDEWIPEDPEI